jgi:hypothetical protein
MGIIRMWNNDIVTYRYMVRCGSFECTVLLRHGKKPEWEEALATPINYACEEVPKPTN